MQYGKDDLIDELIRPIRLTGVFRSWWTLRAPWSIEGDPEESAAVLHYVAEGSCWISGPDDEKRRLNAGDLALFPTGVAHRLADRPDRPGVPLRALLSDRTPGTSAEMALGGDGSEECRLLCAGLHYDKHVATATHEMLPWILVLERETVEKEQTLRDVVELVVNHRVDSGVGGALITLRVFEVAFVLALGSLIQNMLERSEIEPVFGHPAIRRALRIMYVRLDEPWTVESLASEVGMSRSAFTEAFRKLTGDGPAAHLTACRMREAARLLIETDLPLDALAERVGYGSAAGLHLAFRKHFAAAPGAYRSQNSLHGRSKTDSGLSQPALGAWS